MPCHSWDVFWQLLGVIGNQTLVLGLFCAAICGAVYVIERLSRVAPRRQVILYSLRTPETPEAVLPTEEIPMAA